MKSTVASGPMPPSTPTRREDSFFTGFLLYLRLLILVRDPRGYCYSANVTKIYPHGKIFIHVATYIDSLPDLTGTVVVDIPCGDGRASEAFARKGATIRAFDLYPEFNNAEGVTAEYADMGEALPLDAESVDYLICL